MAVAARIIGDVLVRAVLTARDMATERRRAAALDGAHHFELAEAHMAGIGGPPGGPVVAEDIRDLERWSGHGAEALLGGLSFGLAALAGACAEIVERAVHRRDHAGRHAGVAGRRLQLVVTEQRLDHPDIDTAFEQVSGERVAQRMQAHGLGDPGLLDRLLEEARELPRGQRPARIAPGKEPALGCGDFPVLMPRAFFPPLPQQAQDIVGKHHVAVLAPLSLDDPDDVLGAVEIADPEPHHLAGTQAAAIGEQAVMADAMEALGKYVGEKASDELGYRQGHGPTYGGHIICY